MIIPDQLTRDPSSILDLDQINTNSPNALLHGGEHFNDIDSVRTRQLVENSRNTTIQLPRDIIHDTLLVAGYERPQIEKR
jgi:hypothetical protein